MPATEKKFVYCFKRAGALEPPWLGEVLVWGNVEHTLKVGKTKIVVPRDACSTVAYTQADLDKFQPHEARPARSQDLSIDNVKKSITGFFS